MGGSGRCLLAATSGLIDGQHCLGDGEAGPADGFDRDYLGLAVSGGRTYVGDITQREHGVCGGDYRAHGAVVVPLAFGRCRIQPAQHAGQGTQFFQRIDLVPVVHRHRA